MYEYKVTSPMLPPRDKRRTPNSPIMDDRDMEYWLNNMAEHGWEFVSYGAKHWKGSEPFTQEFWVFKREK